MFKDEEKEEVSIVCNLIKGGDLLDQIALKRNNLAEEEAREIYKQILLGLKYLHEVGVCHRDIKPANIMITNDLDRVCIVDFNVAKKKEVS